MDSIRSEELFARVEKLGKEGNVTKEVLHLLKKTNPDVITGLVQDLTKFSDYLKVCSTDNSK